MVCNNFIGILLRFALVSIVYESFYAGSCKNRTASNKANLIVKKQQKKDQATFNKVAMDQEKDGILSESNAQGQKNHTLSEDSRSTHQVNSPPTFRLQEITTIKTGIASTISLEATGQTAGYIIKSVSVQQSRNYYTKEFGVHLLKNKPIPPTGLSIALQTDPGLKTGAYLFKMKIGKTGKGSAKTEQWVQCMIHVIKDEVKNESADASSSALPLLEACNAEAPGQDIPENKKADPPKSIADLPTLKDISIEAGKKQPVILAVEGRTEAYIINAISIKKNIDKAQAYINKPIPSSGLISLKDLSFLSPGLHVLKMKITKVNKSQGIKCKVRVT